MGISKKSKHIHLVLVTALLASCNRVIIPDQSAEAYTPDHSLTAAPADEPKGWDCDCAFDPAYQRNAYPNYDFDFYYSGRSLGYMYTPGSSYKLAQIAHGHQFILRGGFGKTTAATAS